MVVNILLILVACIAFNFLFVYVIDFKGNMLAYYNEKQRERSLVNKKDAFDIFVACVLAGPISTSCFILLLICHIAIWIIDNVLLREDNFIEQENNKLPNILKDFNKLLKASTT